MTAVSSSISKADDGTALIQRTSLQLAAGVRKQLTRAEFDAAVAAERVRIAGNSVGIYPAGEEFSVLGEVGYRTWVLGTGGSDAANAAASHARTVNFGGGVSVALAADANVAVLGRPTTGAGSANGDVGVVWGTGIFIRTSGAWPGTPAVSLAAASTTQVVNDLTTGGATAALSAAQGVALKAMVDSKISDPGTYSLGAGSTPITHAAHANRVGNVNQSGPTSAVFGNAATSGAVANDSIYIRNDGAGTLTASGAITALAGYTLTVPSGYVFSADYSAVADAWFSTTVAPAASVTGAAAPITVSGNAAIGSVLTATPGPGWAISAGNWTRNGANIPGATTLTYTSVSADGGCTVTFVPSGLPYIAAGVLVAAAAPAPSPAPAPAPAPAGTLQLVTVAPANPRDVSAALDYYIIDRNYTGSGRGRFIRKAGANLITSADYVGNADTDGIYGDLDEHWYMTTGVDSSAATSAGFTTDHSAGVRLASSGVSGWGATFPASAGGYQTVLVSCGIFAAGFTLYASISDGSSPNLTVALAQDSSTRAIRFRSTAAGATLRVELRGPAGLSFGIIGVALVSG